MGALLGEPGGGSLLLGTLTVTKRKALEMGISPIGASLGNLEGGSFTRDFKRQMKEGSGNGASFPVGAL